jgi:hypothetical protein
MTDAAEKMTPAHEQTDTIHEDVLYPEHVQRTESATFRTNKHTLVRKLGLKCWLCDPASPLKCSIEKPLEAHHLHEWALWSDLDPAKVLDILRVFDPYGFAHQMGDQPVESPDDIRNLLILCEAHHRGVDTGVHRLTFPIWLPQRAAKPGVQITVLPTY